MAFQNEYESANVPPKIETVLVTGGTGYVAGWCIVELLRRGYQVRTTVRNLSKEKVVRSAVGAQIDSKDRLTFYAADLTEDQGWDVAMKGCDYVLHVASPLGADNPKDPNDLIIPARDGAVRVLRAAVNAKVRRVVMTSACAAASPPSYREDLVTDETFWSDPENKNLTAYMKSKTLAELAAWKFIKEHGSNTSLTTVLPGAVFGPVLTGSHLGSVQVIARLLQGKVPGSPRVGLEVVDVRDLADIHIRAMESPEAAGERFIAAGKFMWMSDIADILRAKLGTTASKVPTRVLPDIVIRFFAVFDPSLRALVPSLSRKSRHTTEKARRVLGWSRRPAADTIVDCAKSLIAHNVV